MDVNCLAKHALEAQREPLTLKDALSSVIDFRIDRKKKFPLYEILVIAVCALIDGAKGPTDYERFGKAKIGLLKRFLRLENGIPSHDTFNRVLTKLDPMRFNAAVVKWLESLTDVAGDIVSIDGKNLRRAITKDGRMPCIVSAHSSRTKLIIGQLKADEKSNEITAIPNLLEMLYLRGAIVTIDAAGCQKRIVRKILKRGADYVISLKGNPSAFDALRAKCFSSQQPAVSGQWNKDETTSSTGCWLLAAGYCDTSAGGRRTWVGLKSVCMVLSEVYDMKTKQTTADTRYFISSLPVDPKRALSAIRAHWGVEAMHWILDFRRASREVLK